MKLLKNYTLWTICIWILSGLSNTAYTQTTSCPEIKFSPNNTPIQLNCVSDTCIRFKSVLPDIRQTINSQTGYIVNSIPFSEAQSFNLTNANQILVNQDDIYSPEINLPFKFCFFGNTFEKVIIGANGSISFNTNMASRGSGYSQCSNNIPITLPIANNNNSLPNSIFPLLHDIDPSVSNPNKKIEWAIVGTAPCRRMIINWISIPHFSGSCNNLISTFQCVLHENTNVIETFVREKATCTTWNCGVATMGVQNGDATIAITPPNRNGAVFTITNANSEGWRYIPNGASLLTNNQVSLYDQNNNLIQSVTPSIMSSGVLEANFTTPACFNGNTAINKQYTVKASYTPCNGNNLNVSDTISINYNPTTQAPIVSSPIVYCQNSSSAPLQATGNNLKWYTTATGGTASNTAPTPSTNNVGTTTYYVSQTLNGCESPRVPIVVNITAKSNSTLNIALCKGLSYTFNNIVYTSSISGVKDTFTNVNGCDSIVTLNLTFKDTSVTTQTLSICTNALPYSWNNILVNSFGDSVARYVGVGNNGCDSIVYLNLNAKPVINQTQNIAICQRQLPYTWNNISVNNGGNGVATFRTLGSNGCDSITTLNLTIKDSVVNDINLSLCSSALPYTWNTQIIRTVGNHNLRHISTGSNGCDSITRLNLTIQDSIVITKTIDTCSENLPFTWNGINITQAGYNVARYTTTSSIGCDSIVWLSVSLKPKDSIVNNITICNNELPYVWNGIAVSNSGNNVARFITKGSDGCDSLTVLNLNVNDTIVTQQNITICNSALPYSWNNISISNAGNGVARYKTIATNGCDSTAVLNLNILRDTVVQANLTICSNQLPYRWNNITVNTGGANVARHSTLSNNGCDSTTILNLTVNDSVVVRLNQTMCSSSLPFTWNGQTIRTVGTSTLKYSTLGRNNCDSITYLALTINDSVVTNITIDTCRENLPFIWNGINITQSGNNVVRYVTARNNGCDSIVNLTVNLKPKDSIVSNLTICNNQLPFLWNGFTVSNSGNNVARFSTKGSDGCDSLTILNLQINDTVVVQQNITLCPRQIPYLWNGTNVNTSGNNVARYKVTGSNGCDSITQLNVTILLDTTVTENIYICRSQLPYRWNGNTLTNGGNNVARFTTTATNTCDSTTILNLIISDSTVNRISQTICSDRLPFSWNNINVNTVGTHTLRYVTIGANQCDSITYLNLVVNDSIITRVTIDTCRESLPFVWNGITVINAGNNTARYSTTSYLVCDSIVYLSVNLKLKDSIVVTETICNNKLPFIWNGFNINLAGNNAAQYITKGSDGCDSLTVLNLRINDTVVYTQPITICNNELPYNWNGINVTNGGNNAATYKTIAANGCDSTTILNLTINDTVVNTVTLRKCQNELPFMWNGQTISNGGNNIASYKTVAANGCDSTTYLNVTVLDTSAVSVNISVCRNQLPYIWNNQSISQSGNAVATFTTLNSNGCDSVTRLNLTILDTVLTTFIDTVCENQLPYTWNGFTLNSGGQNIARYRTTGVNGCDSLVDLSLIVNPVINVTDTLAICENAYPIVWNGFTVANRNSNIYFTTPSLITGCDSTTRLVINTLDTFITRIDSIVCYEAIPFNWHGRNITSSGTYTHILKTINNCDSTLIIQVTQRSRPKTAQEIENKGCGKVVYNNQTFVQNTSWIDTIRNMYGCDSIYQPMQITIYREDRDTQNIEICQGESYTFNNKTYTTNIREAHYFTNIYGCDSVIVVNVKVNRLPVLDIELITKDKLCVGDTVTLQSNGATHYIWNLDDKQFDTNPFTFIINKNAEAVKLEGYSENGCYNAITYTIFAEDCCDIGVPNAFTPNGDGLNDIYKPIIPGNPTFYDFSIFDRWGKRLYNTTKKDEGWDGYIKDEKADVGVYYYIITITCTDGVKSIKKGDVTLIR